MKYYEVLDDSAFQVLVELAFQPRASSKESGLSSVDQLLMDKALIKLSYTPTGAGACVLQCTVLGNQYFPLPAGAGIYVLQCTVLGYAYLYKQPLRFAEALIKDGKESEACQHAIWRLAVEELSAMLASESAVVREKALEVLEEHKKRV